MICETPERHYGQSLDTIRSLIRSQIMWSRRRSGHKYLRSKALRSRTDLQENVANGESIALFQSESEALLLMLDR